MGSMATIDDGKELVRRIIDIYGKGYPTGVKTYANVRDMAFLCGLCATDGEIGSIGICPLNSPVGLYLLSLGGTELTNKREALGVGEDVLSAFGADNDYCKAVLRVTKENLPEGSEVFICGYSLGSMVLQQVLADADFCSRYIIRHAVGIGCPVINPGIRRPIVRINDVKDTVRMLSKWSVLYRQSSSKFDTELLRDGGYKSVAGGHALSYVESPVWDDVDVFGTPDGRGMITVDFGKYLHFFAE